MKNKILFLLSFVASSAFAQDSLRLSTDTVNKTKVHHLKYENNLLINCCAGLAPNNNFANAIQLTIGAGTINGFTCGGTIEAGEAKDCNGFANQSVWYYFVATATTTYVVVDMTGTGTGCYVGSEIWATTTLPTGACHPVSCQSADYGALKDVHQVNTTIGTTYYVQITYATGGVCGTGGCFKINATNVNPAGITNPPPANTCQTSNVTCTFPSPPTVAQITAGCTQYTTAQAPNIVNSVWLNFTTGAVSSQISMNGLITSNCGGGTIDWFDWTLYDANCNIISCGTFPTLTISGMACSTTYNLQISWETAGCTWSSWYWYLNVPNGSPACTVLPIELATFIGIYNGQFNHIEWVCSTETNNDYFTLERSINGIDFSEVTRVHGAGNSIAPTYYSANDNNFTRGAYNYYHLKQTDFDGHSESFWIIAIDDRSAINPYVIKRINPLGEEVFSDYNGFFIEIYNDGTIKKKCCIVK